MLTHPVFPDDAVARNAYRYHSATEGVQSIQMLGHSMNAVSIPKGVELVYHFTTQKEGDAILYTAMIPTQPNDIATPHSDQGSEKGDLRYQVTLDNQQPVVISLKEKYRSEFWKAQVEQINVTKDRQIELVPRVGDHLLILGTADNVEEKLERLMNFYEKGLDNVGWNKYRSISVAYDGQVVCKKR